MYHNWVVRWGEGGLLFALDTDPHLHLNLVPDYGPLRFLRMKSTPVLTLKATNTSRTHDVHMAFFLARHLVNSEVCFGDAVDRNSTHDYQFIQSFHVANVWIKFSNFQRTGSFICIFTEPSKPF